MIRNKKGFSLVELMVVVAIIGILSTIAIPQINKYMARARQTEAKTNLAAVYTANKAFYAEYNIYDNRFDIIGYRPEGKLRYNIGWNVAGTQCTLADYGYTAPVTATAFNAVAQCTVGNAVGANGCVVMADGNFTIPATSSSLNCTADFTAGAIGKISTGSNQDVWSMTNNKVLTNAVDGTQ